MKSRLLLLLSLGLVATPLLSAHLETPKIWQQQCVICHGKKGDAKTPTGRMLKIPSLADPKLGEALTRDRVAQAIKQGVKDEKGNFRMVPYGEGYSDEAIDELVTYVLALDAAE